MNKEIRIAVNDRIQQIKVLTEEIERLCPGGSSPASCSRPREAGRKHDACDRWANQLSAYFSEPQPQSGEGGNELCECLPFRRTCRQEGDLFICIYCGKPKKNAE
jgi:hypothetical protein